MKKALVLVLVVFCVFCGYLVAESGFFSRGRADIGNGLILLQRSVDNGEQSEGASELSESADEPAKLQAGADEGLVPWGGPQEVASIGSVDPNSGYKFQLDLHSKGAAIERATFSEFDDRDHESPMPLDLLAPITIGDQVTMSLENRRLHLIEEDQADYWFELHDMSWEYLGCKTTIEGVQTARFESRVVDKTDSPVLKLTKTYEVSRDSYLLGCSLAVENLSDRSRKMRIHMAGPLGLGREAVRMDGRRTVAGYAVGEDVDGVRLDMKKLRKRDAEGRRLDTTTEGAQFLWAAATNKYFAAIVIPQAYGDAEYANWVVEKVGRLYNPDGDAKANTGDETVGVDFKFMDLNLAAAEQTGSSRTYDFKVYLGPKDKSLFDKDPYYDDLGFVQTIDFLACCCPGWMIKPLAFGILKVMKVMHGVIGNYGIVIIIFVCIMRMILHPITKRSQIQMSKFAKLAPKAEEIKKKYANNKAEMQKQMMELYREGGSAPILGMLPMFVQMPIWVALYSAIYASIDLRGAEFLPFWITDLSVPDALIRFESIFKVPLLGWKIESFNLLPLMMGLAFFLQQKLMPSQAGAASTNPQAAQQQKMMMFMMPIMFPLMLYKAPAGLNLYIMSSTFVGAAEQYFIRKHIRERDEQESKGKVAVTSKTGGKVKRKKPKPFFKK